MALPAYKAEKASVLGLLPPLHSLIPMNARTLISLVVLPLLLGVAHADPDKDESGHGRKYKNKGGEHKEEYWDGRCKVERKWKSNGEYKEERKCKDRPEAYYQPPAVYHPAPEPAIVVTPQIIIRP
jgi:hypothetical protein